MTSLRYYSFEGDSLTLKGCVPFCLALVLLGIVKLFRIQPVGKYYGRFEYGFGWSWSKGSWSPFEGANEIELYNILGLKVARVRKNKSGEFSCCS